MTTIVYDYKNNRIAVDSRCTRDNVITSDVFDKTIRKDGEIWIITGALSDYETISNLKHNDKVEVRPECSALLIKDKKVFSVIVANDGYCSHYELKNNYSMGTGEDFALAALDFGLCAEEAIEYVKTKDVYTGGKVHVFNVQDDLTNSNKLIRG